MNKSEQTSFPYEMGNAGDLLKHGVLAEILRHRLIFQPDQPIRFLDLFAGEPFSGETSDEIVRNRSVVPVFRTRSSGRATFCSTSA